MSSLMSFLRDRLGEAEDDALALRRDQPLRYDGPLVARLEEHRDRQPVRREPDQPADGEDAEQAAQGELAAEEGDGLAGKVPPERE